MKRIIIFLVLALGTLFLFDLGNIKKEEKVEEKEEIIKEEKGVFISYLDYSILKNKSKEKQKEIINEMILNIKNISFNSIILQVRPFSDAIYNSKYYPSSNVVGEEGQELEFDILKYFIDICKNNNIKIYAWINPYRIRNTGDISSINKNNIYYDWINTDDIEVSESGIYFNPASSKALELILNGVEEVAKYDVDGILYDDYFYPNETIDINSYSSTDRDISISEYRINNINNLIEETYKIIKKTNNKIKFGISPSGNIENNLNNEYLDIEYLLNNKYLDFIIPQLYYGFNNSNKPFLEALNTWNDISTNKSELYVGLSLYKSGETDKYAGSGLNEWIDNTDIIKRQILSSRKENNYNGFFIFRYEHLFESNKESINKEINNIKIITK